MISNLKYKIYKIQKGGSPIPPCKSQKTSFLQDYYTNESLNKIKTPNLEKTDIILIHNDNPEVKVIYGEVCGYEVDNLIKELNINESDVFYDLGSGNGHVCATVLFGSNCKKCVGIELSETRHNEGIRIKDLIYNNHPDKVVDKELVLINDNFMNYNYDDATIVFMDSVFYEDKTINEIEKRFKDNPNFRCLVSMKSYYNPVHLKFVKTININASWGQSTLYLYEKP